MKINEDIFNKLNKNLSDDELDKYLNNLISKNEDINEYKKLYNAIKELKANNYYLSEDYKNEILLKVNNKLAKNYLIRKVNTLSYALYFSLAMLIAAFFYNINFNSNVIKENHTIILSDADKALLEEIEPEVKKTMNYSELFIPEKKDNSIVKSKNYEGIKTDEELLALVETNKHLLSENYIPAVDDVLLYECLDDDLIDKIFNKL